YSFLPVKYDRIQGFSDSFNPTRHTPGEGSSRPRCPGEDRRRSGRMKSVARPDPGGPVPEGKIESHDRPRGPLPSGALAGPHTGQRGLFSCTLPLLGTLAAAVCAAQEYWVAASAFLALVTAGWWRLRLDLRTARSAAATLRWAQERDL